MLDQLKSSAKPMIVHVFTIPPSLRDGGPSTIGMRDLTASLEMQAAKIGKLDYTAVQYAALRLSIVELDGAAVAAGDPALERFVEYMNPRLRSLLLAAYNKLSSPVKAEEEDFFGSETLKG